MKKPCRLLAIFLTILIFSGFIFSGMKVPVLSASLKAVQTETDAYNVAAGGIVVYNEAEFKAALADATYTTIYLGANITLSTAPASNLVVARAGTLVINGINPLEPDAGRHTYTDFNSSLETQILRGACTDIAFQDIQLFLRNYYGVYLFQGVSDTTSTTVTFDHVTGSARQFFYGNGASSTLVVKNSDLMLSNTGLGVSQELAERMGTVRFEGNVTVTRNPLDPDNGYDEFFYFWHTKGTVEIADGANVKLNNRANKNISANIFYDLGTALIIGNDALLNCYSAQGFCEYPLSSIAIGDRSDVRFIYTGTGGRAYYPLHGTSFTAGVGSNFLLYDNSTSATYGAFHFTNVILNTPESFILLNSSARAIGTNTTNLTATGVSSVRYYSSGQISSLFDTGTYAYRPSRTFFRWWAQKNPFNVTANNWSGSSPTITSNYDGNNVPTASVAVMSSLASSNFSASSSVYGIEIRGTIYTLTYHGNGADSGQVPASDAGVPGETIVIQGNTGNLARTDYLFNDWNTALDGSGTPYSAGDSITLSADVTLYAQWVSALNQTASIDVAYYFNGVHDSTYDTTITPQILSTVTQSDVVLTTSPLGYKLAATPTSPTLPADASGLDGGTVKVYYVTDLSQTASIDVAYYFDRVHDSTYDKTITPQILSIVTQSDVVLATTPLGYTLAAIPTSPTLPADASGLNGGTVKVYYVTDLSQTASIDVAYYFNGVHDSTYDTAITPQILSTVTQSDVVLATTPLGYMLAAIPTSPTLPADASGLDGGTVKVYYVTDLSQTASIDVAYYFDRVHDSTYDTTITPQILSIVTQSDVVLATTPLGYTLAAPPTSPTLPADASGLDGGTVKVYYVTDLSQTASIDVAYYFDGVHDSTYDTAITPQILSTVTQSDVVLTTSPLGYKLAAIPTSPTLPADASGLNGGTVKVYYVTDLSQTAGIDVAYYFDGVHDSTYDTAITPHILSTVTRSDVVLATTPVGYTLAAIPTSPTLPADASSLDGGTVKVYYVYNGNEGPPTTPCTVTYHANDGTGSYADTNLAFGSSYTVLGWQATGISRDGYTFNGWNSAADGSGVFYAAGDLFTITGDVTLYAQWVDASNPEIGIPATGDNQHLFPWGVASLASLAFLVVLTRRRRTRCTTPDILACYESQAK